MKHLGKDSGRIATSWISECTSSLLERSHLRPLFRKVEGREIELWAGSQLLFRGVVTRSPGKLEELNRRRILKALGYERPSPEQQKKNLENIIAQRRWPK